MLSSDRDALRDFAGGAFICNEHLYAMSTQSTTQLYALSTEYQALICNEHQVPSPNFRDFFDLLRLVVGHLSKYSIFVDSYVLD